MPLAIVEISSASGFLFMTFSLIVSEFRSRENRPAVPHSGSVNRATLQEKNCPVSVGHRMGSSQLPAHLALQPLDRAYAEGFRMIWVLDLNPLPLFYIDSIDEDPAFATLKADPRYRNWRERIRADNALQLERLRARLAEAPAA